MPRLRLTLTLMLNLTLALTLTLTMEAKIAAAEITPEWYDARPSSKP